MYFTSTKQEQFGRHLKRLRPPARGKCLLLFHCASLFNITFYRCLWVYCAQICTQYSTTFLVRAKIQNHSFLSKFNLVTWVACTRNTILLRWFHKVQVTNSMSCVFLKNKLALWFPHYWFFNGKVCKINNCATLACRALLTTSVESSLLNIILIQCNVNFNQVEISGRLSPHSIEVWERLATTRKILRWEEHSCRKVLGKKSNHFTHQFTFSHLAKMFIILLVLLLGFLAAMNLESPDVPC